MDSSDGDTQGLRVDDDRGAHPGQLAAAAEMSKARVGPEPQDVLFGQDIKRYSVMKRSAVRIRASGDRMLAQASTPALGPKCDYVRVHAMIGPFKTDQDCGWGHDNRT
jgi:hypothetical protein